MDMDFGDEEGAAALDFGADMGAGMEETVLGEKTFTDTVIEE